jgi:hypothetical protein
MQADNHVATVTLNRPEAMNSFNQAMCAPQALRIGLSYTHIGNPVGQAEIERSAVARAN